MKRTSLLLMSLAVIAFTLVASLPTHVQAHGGLGGFHGGVHAGGVHAGGFHAGGFHAGGHVGYYPHYHPGVGYYHPVVRAAAWNRAYNNTFGYGGYNPYPYQGGGGPSFSTGSTAGASSGSGDSALTEAAAQAKQQLDAELNADAAQMEKDKKK